MSIVVNTNTAASLSALNLSKSNTLLQKSLARLSSGSRIAEASDDAGGLAVSMKLTAALKRSQAQATNISNALSFLQTQDGVMASANSVLSRIGELATMYSDVTKSSLDKANYDTEFTNLVAQYNQFQQAEFNGIELFGTDAAGSLDVYLTDDGAQSMLIHQSQLTGTSAGIGSVLTSTNLSGLSSGKLSIITAALQELATMRATNGAQSSRLQHALEALEVNMTNLESANSRIYDVDVAQESTRLARNSILVQSGAAMLAQANSSAQIALRLIQGQ
jgi:flagellin